MGTSTPLGRIARAALVAALLLPLSDAAALESEDGPSPIKDPLVTKDQQRAVVRGLEWLAKSQSSGGSWGDPDETLVADTSLAVMSLMAGGNTVAAGGWTDEEARTEAPPRLRGRYARNVRDGIEYLARLAIRDERGRARGYIQADKVSKMHGHGFATLALALACGNLGGGDIVEIKEKLGNGVDANRLTYGEKVRYALERAVRLIERAQDPDSGGWLYDPLPNGHEGSMTVTQIHALRAAQDAGVSVSGVVLRRAYQYVRDSQNLADQNLFGGFAYHKTLKGRVSYALTGAALTTFYGLGRYGDIAEDTDLIRHGMSYLDRTFEDALGARQWYYYGLYYGAQAIYQQHDRRRLRDLWPRIRRSILNHQSADGSFERVGDDGRSLEYCTSMATLTLQIPDETLPIFQRR